MKQVPLRVHIVSLGCAKNLVDSEVAVAGLLEAGCDLAVRPEDADVVIVNTCGFLQDARDEGADILRSLLHARRRHARQRRHQQIVAIGCWAERSPEEVKRLCPGLDAAPDAVWGLSAYRNLPRLVAELAAGQSPSPDSEPFTEVYTGPRLLTTGPAYAYLKIADGCDNLCAYCAIPKIRGRFRARTPDGIVAEARDLEAQGVKELVVIAQDTTAYDNLAGLLRRLLAETAVPRIRLLYAHPAHLDEDTVDLLAGEERLCRYLDLPLQHVSDRVLRAMNRGYDRKRIDHWIRRFARVPGFTLRTTLLAGFPGETEAEFGELLAFVNEGHFAHIGAFAWSPEEGTAAFDLPHPVPPDEARRRRDRILEAQQAVAFRCLDARVGGTEDVLLEGPDRRGRWRGRSIREAPDADGVILVRGRGLSAGAMIPACIVRRDGYDLEGRKQ